MMRSDPSDHLLNLAHHLQDAAISDLVDVFLTRVADTWWRLEHGVVRERRSLFREGAAVRTTARLCSSDGLDRVVVANLLGVRPRAMPAFSLPPPPTAPTLGPLPPVLESATLTLHWRGSWAAVLREGRAIWIRRPELFEVVLPDGLRGLTTWPPSDGWRPPEVRPVPEATIRPGRFPVLLAPPAAAVLVHELLGHPLEGDLVLAGASPWADRLGQPLFDLPIDVDDDPTAALPGGFSCDDEGIPAQRRPLVRGGALVSFLADRASAEALGVPPGNARRATLHTPPYPRMSNLLLRAPGGQAYPPRDDAKIEVTSLSSGALEPRVNLVRLQVRTAYQLRRGKRARALAPFSLVSTADELRQGLAAVGSRSVASAEPGWCTKDGGAVPTGAKVPWMLLRNVEVR